MVDNLSSDILEDFLNWLDECETQLHICEADEKMTDEQTQDILHRLELFDDSYLDRKKMCDALPYIRRKRRESKNGVELFTPVSYWAESNKKCISSLKQLLGELRKVEKKQRDRVYCTRTDIVKELIGKDMYK